MNDTTLSRRERAALEYLQKSLPAADRISFSEDELLRVVRRALFTRDEAVWGNQIPDDIFYAFTLFPRVNNEDLVFYQETLHNEIMPGLIGKPMTEAALYVNYWCLEHATYQSTDGRTANPLTVMRRAFGRCGEESVLLVSALRSVCIPARIVYVPRWSHCDDNHAWTEVWIDGSWHYMGSCEPEPVVDSGWFTSAASKAMLVHTKAYGLRPDHERIEGTVGDAYIINRTAAYAKTKLLTVRVTENGAPRAGITVRFEVINMSELYPINQQKTDGDGVATLRTGLGVIHLHITDGHRYVNRVSDVSREDEVIIDFAQAVTHDAYPRKIRQFPPAETRIQPVLFPEQIAREHARRIAECEQRRAAYESTFAAGDTLFAKARGNQAVIRDFLTDARCDMEDRQKLLSSLRDKDLVDITRETLDDALAAALPAKTRYPEEVWVESVLCPRVRNEFLEPVRGALRRVTGPYCDAISVWTDIEARVTVADDMPDTIYPKMMAVLESGRAGALMRDILYVAIARAHGFAARLNPATGDKEYYENGRYRPIHARFEKDAKLNLINASDRKLLYGEQFTLAVLEKGVYKTLWFDGLAVENEKEIEVYAGQYRALTCVRQIDGSIDALTIPFAVEKGAVTNVTLTLCDTRERELITRVKIDAARVTRDGKTVYLPNDTSSSKAIYAFLAPGQEPTEHFLNELVDAKTEISKMDVCVYLIIDRDAALENRKLQLVLREIPSACLCTDPDMPSVLKWRSALRAGDMRLPFAVAVNEAGEALFSFVNYHVGSVRSLLRILSVE